MVRLRLFVILFILVKCTQAQEIFGTLHGVVIDSISQEGVEFASVIISKPGEKKIQYSTQTKDKGSFKVARIMGGQYHLLISFVGYKTKTIPFQISSGDKDLNIGTIELVPLSKSLKEVIIAASPDLIENKIDKVIYNADKDVSTGNGTAGDVLRKVPMVDVDQDGNVSLRGTSSVKIFLNGKPSGMFSGDVGDALKSISASEIKSVEVITNPSSKYDSEGGGGIINIVTHKRVKDMMNGGMNASIGNRRSDASTSLGTKRGKLGIYSNVGGNWMWPQTTINEMKRKDLNNVLLLEQNGTNKTFRGTGKGSLGLDYEINEKNTIGTTVNATLFGYGQDGTTQLLTYQSGLVQSYTTRDTQNELWKSNIDWLVDYRKTFDKKGQELAMAGQYSFDKRHSFYTTTMSDSTSGQQANSNDYNHEYTLQLDYTHPLTSNTLLEAGGRSVFRNLDSHFDVNSQEGSSFVYSSSLSNIFHYYQNVYATYGVLSLELPARFSIKGGLRYEYTALSFSSQKELSFVQPNNYYNWMPNVLIAKKVGKVQLIKLSYNQRIQRPSAIQLSPFVNANDPRNSMTGNPSLKPELTKSLELGYNLPLFSPAMLSLSMYYKRTENMIENVLSSNIEQETVNSSFKNVGVNNSLGGNVFGTVGAFKGAIILRGSFNIYTYNVSVYDSIKTELGYSKVPLQWLYSSNANLTYQIIPGLYFEVFGSFQSPKRTVQGTRATFTMWSMGLKKELWEKKGSIGLNVIELNSNYKYFISDLTTSAYTQSTKNSVPFRSVGITFSYNLGAKSDKTAIKRKALKKDNSEEPKSQEEGL